MAATAEVSDTKEYMEGGGQRCWSRKGPQGYEDYYGSIKRLCNAVNCYYYTFQGTF